MKKYIFISFSFLLIILFACSQTSKPSPYPSDYMFSQRAYPYGKIDLKAYKNALSNKHKYLIDRKSFSEESWISQGPFNYSGRITDLELVPGNDNLIYAGTASGGIYKSDDGGSSWASIFDDSKSLSIGDMALYDQNPLIIYAGTGESNAGGGSVAYDGLGVYKSTNGGDSWQEMGLDEVGSIGKIVIDPVDPDVVFVAAMGTLFANNPERGVYKTLDGGKNWRQVFFLSDSTGAIDLAIHPNNGNIIYAAMWERIRRHNNRQYGGETSGLYKSIDGGETWFELNNGLPELASAKGRIGIAISKSDPDILYAFYANTAGFIEGIYKTEDGGQNWIKKSAQNISNVSYTWWFGKIYVHPMNPDKVYACSLNMFASEDGAESWKGIYTGAHVDHHALAIGSLDTNLVYNGNDGGVYSSSDNGQSIESYLPGIDNFQFYACKVDPNNPDRIYGGAQDNGTNVTDGDAYNWKKLFGGDGFRILVDPNDSDQIYFEYQNGNIFGSTDAGETNYNATSGLFGDFNWNTPLAMDPKNSHILYTGAQHLFKSLDKGISWEAISDDLFDIKDSNGNLTFGSLTTIDVSTLNSDIIYMGSDDGSVWVTKDRGLSYIDISEGLPLRWITSITHDPHVESGVYVTVSGFRFGESDSHVFYSNDFGFNWRAIGAGLPDIPVNDIVADDMIEDQLYLATDIGVFYSDDKGISWNILGNDFPVVPIIDLDLHSPARRLAAASFGKGLLTYDLPPLSSIKNNAYNFSFVLYPNPTRQNLFIATDTDVKLFQIFNKWGQLELEVQDTYHMDISLLEVGTYVLKLTSSHGVASQKFIKL